MPEIYLMGAVRGLEAEGKKARKAFEKYRPDIVAISISKEGIKAMENHFERGQEIPEPANLEEEMYIEGLSEFGKVIRPPPCFSEAWKIAGENNKAVWGLDMDDEHFTSAFCKHVSTLDMVRQGRCEKKWARHAFVAKGPEEFVLEWDRVINWLPGYQRLEKERETWFAKGISQLAKKHDKVLAIIEVERLAGTAESLDGMGVQYQTLDSEI